MANDSYFEHELLQDPVTSVTTGAKNPYLFNDFYMRATGLMIVLESYRNAPPASPVNGDSYLIGTGPSGAWSLYPKHIAIYAGNGWTFIAPKIGMQVYSLSVDKVLHYTDQFLWFGPEFVIDLGTLSTGSYALSTQIYGINYFRFAASSTNVTILASVYSNCVRGFEYTFIASNTNAGPCNVILQTSGWVCNSSSFSVASNSMLVFKAYRAATENRMIVSTAVNGLVNN